MATNQDPYTANVSVGRRESTKAELAVRQQKIEARRARMRAVLAPYVNRGLRDESDNPITKAGRLMVARRRLAKVTDRLRAEAEGRDGRMAEFLNGRGKNLPDRLKRSLNDVVDGVPRFVTGLSYDQANRMHLNRSWPGSITGRNLTGNGTAVAMWDIGGVDTGHEQFTTGSSSVVAPDIPGSTARVVHADISPLIISEHSTAVATCIVGAGDPSVTLPGQPFGASPTTNRDDARGMAYEGGLRVYDEALDTLEMGDLADDTLAGTLDIVFSNHSYGTFCGWQRPYLAPAGSRWLWYGDPHIGESSPGAGDSNQDYKFGFYMPICRDIDQVVHAAEIYLPIWAAGNEGSNLDPLEAPVAQEAGPIGSGRTPHLAVVTGVIYDWPAQFPDPPLRQLDIGSVYVSNLIPEACAKNVLTVTTSNHHGSTGGTDDWRMKPELQVSNAVGLSHSDPQCAKDGPSGVDYRLFAGTSFAAAAATGGMALLRERWLQLNGDTGHVLASTWKCIAMAGAEPLHPASARAYYGQFNFEGMMNVIEEDAEVTEFGKHSRIKEIVLENGASAEFKIQVVGINRSYITICWTDPAGTPPSPSINPPDVMLVNDIDLRVIAPDGTVLFPRYISAQNGSTSLGDNSVDNVEQIELPFGSQNGEWTVRITHKGSLRNLLPQTVSVVTGASSIAPVFRILDFSETAPDTYNLTWASTVGGVYQVDASSDLETWTPFTGEVIANNEITSYPIDTSAAGATHFFRVRQTF